MNELEKWSQAQPTLTAIRDFLEWCDRQQLELSKPRPFGTRLERQCEDRERMLARYLGIDTVALENERRALLAKAPF